MSTTCIDNSTLYLLVNQNMGNHNIKFNEREKERDVSHAGFWWNQILPRDWLLSLTYSLQFFFSPIYLCSNCLSLIQVDQSRGKAQIICVVLGFELGSGHRGQVSTEHLTCLLKILQKYLYWLDKAEEYMVNK